MLAPAIASIEFYFAFCAGEFDDNRWLRVAFLKNLCQRPPPKLRSNRSTTRCFRGGVSGRSRGRLSGGRFRRGKALASHRVSPYTQIIGCRQLQHGREVSPGTLEIV